MSGLHLGQVILPVLQLVELLASVTVAPLGSALYSGSLRDVQVAIPELRGVCVCMCNEFSIPLHAIAAAAGISYMTISGPRPI